MNLRFNLGNITYTTSGLDLKVDAKVKWFDHASEQDRQESEDRERFMEHCRHFELTPTPRAASALPGRAGNLLHTLLYQPKR